MRADTPPCAKSFPLQMEAPVLQTTHSVTQCACDVYRKSVSLWIFFVLGHWADTHRGTPAEPPAVYTITGA